MWGGRAERCSRQTDGVAWNVETARNSPTHPEIRLLCKVMGLDEAAASW